MAQRTLRTVMIMALAGTVMAGCSSAGTKSDTKEPATDKTVEIMETINVSDSCSYDIITVDQTAFLQLNGEGSLADWRICEGRHGGYWRYDMDNIDGALNPDFAICMRDKGYVLETQLSDAMLAKLNYDHLTSSQWSKLSGAGFSQMCMSQSAKAEMMASSSTSSSMTGMMTETIVNVDGGAVMGGHSMTETVVSGGSSSMVTGGTITETTTTTTTMTSSGSSQSGTILETLTLSGNKSYDIVTVNDVLFIRLNGLASMSEWWTCERQTNGYWTFETNTLIGSLKPEFESCMRGLDYSLDRVRDDALPDVMVRPSAELIDETEIVELTEATDVEADEAPPIEVQPTP